MAHDVFISYSSRDKPTADAVCYELEAAGIRCWIAPRDILPGQHWGAAIVEAIHSSRLMVLILSANANASDQVLREVERSVHRSIPIIPFRIEEFELASAFEYYLSVPHWLDAMTGPMEDHIQRLVHTAKVLLDQERPPQAVPAAPPQSPGPAPDDDAQLEAVVRPQPGDFAPPPPREPPAAAAMPTVAVASMASASPRVATPPSSVKPVKAGLPIWVWVAPIVILVAAIAVGGARVLPSLIAAPAQPTGLVQPTASIAIQVPSLPATQPPQVAPGIVRITSSVEGAAILVDGQPAGRTPQSLVLQPGGYQLTLQAATYRDWEQRVEVAEGQQVPVQAILDPLQPLDVLEVIERALGRDAAVDTGRIVRVRTPVDTFQVSDVVNAVVYFRPKTYQIRDISYNVTHRWEIAGASEPGVVAATARGSRDEPLLFTHACALAAQVDPRGSGVPLSLEVLIESEVVARFGFRVAGGSLSNAPPDAGQACDRSRLPNVVVAAPQVETRGGHAF